MRESRFWVMLEDEFGPANAGVIATSLELPGLNTTAQTALSNGVSPRTVWTAICDLHGIPAERRLGKDKAPRDTGTI